MSICRTIDVNTVNASHYMAGDNMENIKCQISYFYLSTILPFYL